MRHGKISVDIDGTKFTFTIPSKKRVNGKDNGTRKSKKTNQEN